MNETLHQGAIYDFIKEKTLMPPPFLEFSTYGRYSMGWRMGMGEGYVMKFGAWLKRFCREDQAVYKNLFPAPITLFDYWDNDFDKMEFPEEYEHGELFSYRWSLTGSTKYDMAWFRKAIGEKGTHRFHFFENSIAYGKKEADPFSIWTYSPFVPPCFPEGESMACAADFLAYCAVLYTGRKGLIQSFWKNCGNPEALKSMGPKISRYTDVEWKKIFPEILALSQYFKFSQNSALRERLIASDDEIFLCMDSEDLLLGCRIVTDPNTGEQKIIGENLLGFAIMNARDEIRKIYGNLPLCENFC